MSDSKRDTALPSDRAVVNGANELSPPLRASVPSAFELMQKFYASRYYQPKPARPADNVQAAIQFTLDVTNAGGTSNG